MVNELFQFDVEFCLNCENHKSELKKQISFQRGVYYWFASQKATKKMNLQGEMTKLHSHNFNNHVYYLVYIGIGPRNEYNKTQFIKERIVNKHLGNNISTSTLRFAIASTLELQAYIKKNRRGLEYCLEDDSEQILNDFLKNEFCIGICKHDTPWDVEATTIQSYEPPLNSADNKNGWNYRNLSECRKKFRGSARLFPFNNAIA